MTTIDLHCKVAQPLVGHGSQDHLQGLLDADGQASVQLGLQSHVVPPRFECLHLEVNDVTREALPFAHFNGLGPLFRLQLRVGDTEHTTEFSDEGIPKAKSRVSQVVLEERGEMTLCDFYQV